ncbi:hypothetical protein [Clostridium sardiniense]|uniref:hypothetical protein n=1 Tax=Clostridium sardiniense TaxID=29369 RepID=UPI001FAF21F4|nr:hypothetical protein [Clostridium sardiniense]MBM7833978.1 hypothetical protein [Clostridium sardiniense]
MAHNKLYRNFIILQEDDKSKSSSNDKALSGYAKIEAKGEKCKITFYAQNLKKDDDYAIVLICYKKDMKQIIDMGPLTVNEVGKGEACIEYYSDNIAGLSLGYDKISGAGICKKKSGNLDFSMYGFMNGEKIEDGWKKMKVVNCYDKSGSTKSKEYYKKDDVKKYESKKDKDKKCEEKKYEKKHEDGMHCEKMHEEKKSHDKDDHKHKCDDKKRDIDEDDTINENDIRDDEIQEHNGEIQEHHDEDYDNENYSVDDEIRGHKKYCSGKKNYKKHDKKMHCGKMHGEKMYDDKMHCEKMHGEKMYDDKMHCEMMHGEKMYDDKMHGEKMHDDKMHCGMMHGEKMYDDKMHCGKMHGEKMYDNKMHCGMMHGDKMHCGKMHDRDEDYTLEENDIKDYEIKDYHNEDYNIDDEIRDNKYYCGRDDLANNFEEYERRIEEQKIDPYDFSLRGGVGNFFENLVKEFEEVKGGFKEISYCKWFKIPVRDIEDMCNSKDYNKYSIIYYPMLNYYPYIKKYGYFMMGYKCDSKGNLKYLVYAIPGKRDREEQPYCGKSGFVTWCKRDCDRNGFWLMFYDYKNSTVVVPSK